MRKNYKNQKQWPSPRHFEELMALIKEKYNYACFIAGMELTFDEFIRTWGDKKED